MSLQNFHGSDLEKIATHFNLDQDSIINFAGNVNPLGASTSTINALKNQLNMISNYPDRHYTSLKKSIAKYVKSPLDYILIGSGSTELIGLGISHIKAKKALILGPTYSEYARELNLANCSLEEFNIPLDVPLHTTITGVFKELLKGYDFLIICNPNNPTGWAFNRDQLSLLIDFCKEHHIFVMIDETYIEFTRDVNLYSAISLCHNYDNLLVLRGFSKFFAAPGIRLGYGITSNMNLKDSILTYQNPWSVNTLGAYAGELMLMDTEYMDATRDLVTSERSRISSKIEKLDIFYPYPSESNFILVKILSPTLTSKEVFESCIKKGLFIRDCKSFFGDEGEFIRFCLMHPSDNDKLLSLLQDLNKTYA